MFFELGETSGRKFTWYVDSIAYGGGAHRAFNAGRKHSTVSGPYQVNARHLGLEKTNFVTDIT